MRILEDFSCPRRVPGPSLGVQVGTREAPRRHRGGTEEAPRMHQGANLEPICCNLAQFGANMAQFGAHMGSIWSQIGRLWAHLGPFWLKFGATVGPYIHMSTLYSPWSTVYVFLGPYSTVHTSIAHRILLHKQTRPQQYQLQSLPAALCESTIASCPLPAVYRISPLPITYCPLPRSAGPGNGQYVMGSKGWAAG